MACDVPRCHLAVNSLFETPNDVLGNPIFSDIWLRITVFGVTIVPYLQVYKALHPY